MPYYNIGRKKILRGRVWFPTGGKVRELVIWRISGQRYLDRCYQCDDQPIWWDSGTDSKVWM